MDDLIAKIVVGIVSALAAWGLGQIKSQRLLGVAVSVIRGLEKGTQELGPDQAKAVKAAVKVEAERTGAQDRLHALVKQITEEKA